MCLTTVDQVFEPDFAEEGIGYKAVLAKDGYWQSPCVLHARQPNGWLEQSLHVYGVKSIPFIPLYGYNCWIEDMNKGMLCSDNYIQYICGFHLLLTKTDAKRWRGFGIIKRVKYQGVTARGSQGDLECVVAKRIYVEHP